MSEKAITAITVKHTPTAWTAEVGERLSDGSDCWVINSEEHSIAEMMCPKDVEEANARFIERACNAYPELVLAVWKASIKLPMAKHNQELNDLLSGLVQEARAFDPDMKWPIV